MRIRRHADTRHRPGSALLAVLVIVALLSLASYQYSELMFQEYRAADSSMRALQAKAVADSGIHYIAAVLADPTSFQSMLNGNPYDNQSALSQVQVYLDSKTGRTGRFSVVCPVDNNTDGTGSGPTAFRYGVIDECGKINLNALIKVDSTGQVAHDVLMKLPNMTEDIADAIVDWIDADDEPRASGAESSYYQGLSPPYRCKNAPLDTLEELLMVRGVTAQLLFGNDRNHNGMQDQGEDDGSGWNAGWSAYLTVYSRERNVDVDGNARAYLNDSNLQTQHDSLVTAVGQDLADFITLWRTQTDGTAPTATVTMSTTGTASGAVTTFRFTQSQSRAATVQEISDKVNSVLKGGSSSSSGASGATGGAGTGGGGGQQQVHSLSSRYQLIGATVSWTIGTGRNQQTVTLASPLNDKTKLADLLPKLLDKTSTQQTMELPGRVNVLTAPQSVLASLPGLTDTDVTTIMQARPDPTGGATPDAIYSTPAWLVTDANISTAKMQALERYITSRTQIYRVQVLGQFDQGGPFARVEAVIDVNAGKPRIVMYRELTEFGRGYDLSQQQ
ncbi:MAG: hypothetical protein ACJ8F7_23515 [Gemmataceae bacterium]